MGAKKNPAISACQSAIAITLPLGLWRVFPLNDKPQKTFLFGIFPFWGKRTSVSLRPKSKLLGGPIC